MASVDAPTKPGFWGWLNKRMPVEKFLREQLLEYYAPKNFNIWYFFGSLAMLVLVMQLFSGIFLAMFYKVGDTTAFDSVEYIMREVDYGWLIRYLHSTGASAFFVVVYLHMYRALMYGSYKTPRELLWLFGMFIYLALMAEAFMGYVLPWGQMSFWGAQVIVNLFGAIPIIGPDLSIWIRGDYVVSDATLNRFFSFHVIAIPLVLLGLVAAHILALHEVGSNNPDGIEIKDKKDEHGIPLDGIPFHPYYTIGHDLFAAVVFLMVFSAIVFFAPEMGGYFLEYNNFIAADPLKTPPHIAPVWYFTPYYSILRAMVWNFFYIDAKVWGVIGMGASTLIFFFLPWLDRSPVKSIRYRPGMHKVIYAVFVVCFFVLGYLGTQPPSPVGQVVSQIGTVLYFAFFLGMPWWSRMGQFKPVPDRVTM